ncbi:hypothetical protein PMAC_003405 [Pneumocystis sp. 'macacae']|nr:hypothetical protein PMAC_003405 [Pneumocystis sp. 'macacae']
MGNKMGNVTVYKLKVKAKSKCLFLEGACPTELKDECNKLRNKCYQKKRDRVAGKRFFEGAMGAFKEENRKQKLKQVCPELSGESDELTVLCLAEEFTGDRVQDFEPTRPGLTVTEEIELQELLWGGSKGRSLYWATACKRCRKDAGSGVSNKCKKVLEEKCKRPKEHELRRWIMETKECDELEKSSGQCSGLTTKTKNKYLVDTSPNNWPY